MLFPKKFSTHRKGTGFVAQCQPLHQFSGGSSRKKEYPFDGAVIEAGVHGAPNIKTAEAAKVIENTQRDLNIALMNELALIFSKHGLDTKEVLEAAGLKQSGLSHWRL